MTEQEYLDLEQLYLAETQKRQRARKIQEILSKIKDRREDNPSILFAKETIPLTPEQKTLVCNFIIGILEKELEKII